MTECEDAISRADVDNVLYEYWHDINIVDDSGYFIYKDSMDIINKLPSVKPKPKMGHWKRVTDKTGHWVWECDKCYWQQRLYTNFCPNCGAKMESEVEE